MVDGDYYIECDDEGFVYDDFKFFCGCCEIWYFYYDGFMWVCMI